MRGDATKVFDPPEESLDKIAGLLLVGIEIAWIALPDAGGNVGFGPGGADRFDRCFGVVSIVGNDLLGANTFDEGYSFDNVVDLSSCQPPSIRISWK
jgi:hypothetical protein